MSAYLPHLILMFVGGLVSSLGLGQWARSARGRKRLEGTSLGALIIFSVVALAAMGLAAWWILRTLLQASGGADPFGSPWPLLLFGLAVGLPMGLPQLVGVWRDVRPEKQAERARKAAETTAEEREEYARELLEEVHRASPEPRKLEVFVRGDEGRVLWFEGELAQDEGERLVKALQRNLKEKGFRRVETRGSKGNWWTNV